MAIVPAGLVFACLTLTSSARATCCHLTSAAPQITGFPILQHSGATAGEPFTGGHSVALAPAPDGSDAEWLVLNGRRQQLYSITPSGQQELLANGAFTADNGPPDAYASVDADGYDWVLDDDQGLPEDTLYAVGAPTSQAPGVNPVATFSGYAQDLTLGGDGALYLSDQSGGVIRCAITPTPSATCDTIPLVRPLDGGSYTVGASAELTWFTDAAGELASMDPSGAVDGPYGDVAPGVGALSVDPGTIVTAANGRVYAAAGAETEPTGNGAIVSFDPGRPATLSVVASGLANVVSLALGPDGNIWFLDAGADGGAGAVSRLTLRHRSVREYPLPAGMSLPVTGAQIAAGPAVPDARGDGELFFTALAPSSSAGAEPTPAVGEVSNVPFPVVSGKLAFKSSVTVSRGRVAILTLTCGGAGNAECDGRLRLHARARIASRPGAAATASKRSRQFSLGSVRYKLRGGRTLRYRLRLSRAAFSTLEQAAHRRFTVRLRVRARRGSVSGRTLTLTGPRPRHAGADRP